MSLLQTPTCEVTGLPLPIRPSEPPKGARFGFHDYHHHFHPEKKLTNDNLSSLALRYSRGQDVPRSLHDRYHDIFDGPPIPKSESDRFTLTILACAGVIPRVAIDLSEPRTHQVLELSDKEHQILADNQVTHIETATRPDNRQKIRNTIGRFIACYALDQDISSIISDRVVDEFVHHSTDILRKKELGNFILREAVGHALDPVVSVHNIAKQEGLTPSHTHRQKSKTIASTFFTRNRLPDYHAELTNRLVKTA